MNPEGTKLCAAGTMSDYAAVVSRATFAYTIAAQGKKPYWVTNSGDGRYCFVSFSGDDRVGVVSYAREAQVASIPVGDHPQRMRMGRMRCDYLGPQVDCAAPRVRVSVIRRQRTRRRLKVRLSEPARLRIVISRGRRATVRVLNRRGRKGLNRISVGKLRRGARRRVAIRATDAAGNASARKLVRFRVRRR
jgi:hypothetical protein